ncbi:MAG: archaeal proteasome endopeptidase complex subunit alpha [Nanoarchaeota archaeon]
MPTDIQHQVMGYDRTATMFSPEGHLLQVEYAERTVRLGSSSIGIVCSDGVLILADKRLNDKLLIPKSLSKIYEVDDHVISTAAGISSDARILIEKAQLIAQQHKVTYDSPIEPEMVIKEIANVKQMFTQYGGARPFGVSVMIAGINKEKPEVYVSDVTGNYFSYTAGVIGENDERIKEKLREYYKLGTVEEGIRLGLRIFKEIQEKNFDINRFEASFIDKDNINIVRLDGEKLKKYIK